MTEIPEHLLKRSKARRDAIGQSGDAPAEGESAAPSAAVERAAAAPPAAAAGPAAVAAVPAGKAPAAPAPPPPPPLRPEVAAAKARKKIPYWAAPALVALPFWAIIYATTLDPVAELSPVIAEGQAIYADIGCAGCHGPAGGGGVGPAFTGGALEQTFPEWQGHVDWVHLGAANGANPDGSYGNPDREGGPHNVADLPGVMPGYEGTLSDEEILAVVRYEREVLSEYGCEPDLAEATGEECAPGTEAETAAGG